MTECSRSRTPEGRRWSDGRASLVRALLLAMVAALPLVAACGLLGPERVTLAELARDAERYDDREVSTTGMVREFDEDDGALERHFVIEDARANRVLLEPDDAAAPHVGEAVRVVGRFTFDPETGRALEVDVIERAAEDL